jgi:hypothetical protein
MAEAESFLLNLNGSQMVAPSARLTALQLRLLARVPAEFQLILECNGGEPDRILSDTDVLDLSTPSVRVFSKPPTAFGSARNAGL